MSIQGVSTKWMFSKLGSAFTIKHTGGRKKSSEGRMQPLGLSLATPDIDIMISEIYDVFRLVDHKVLDIYFHRCLMKLNFEKTFIFDATKCNIKNILKCENIFRNIFKYC